MTSEEGEESVLTILFVYGFNLCNETHSKY